MPSGGPSVPRCGPISKALGPVSKSWAGAPGWAYLAATLAFLTLCCGGMKAFGVLPPLRAGIPRRGRGQLPGLDRAAAGRTSRRRRTSAQALGVGWSLNLTAEAGFIVALVAGLLIGNFLPRVRGLAEGGDPARAVRQDRRSSSSAAFLGITATEQLGLATSVMFRGLCAIVEAYLIYWASSITSRAGTSNSAASGPRRWPRASRSAASRRPSPPAPPSRRGRWCR